MSAPSEDTQRMLGEINGKLDSMLAVNKEWREEHREEHTKINQRLTDHAEDINKAKGAKGAILWVAGGVAGFIAFAAPYIAKALGLK